MCRSSSKIATLATRPETEKGNGSTTFALVSQTMPMGRGCNTVPLFRDDLSDSIAFALPHQLSHHFPLGNILPMPRPSVLALDLEGTLISNAVSQIPRPGLFTFLERCRELFPRIVMFTTVSETRFRAIASVLIQERATPTWFGELEYVSWTGATKDLALIRDAAVEDCLLVDDFEAYVHPGQHAQWICIDSFSHPYEASDTELITVFEKLRVQLSQ